LYFLDGTRPEPSLRTVSKGAWSFLRKNNSKKEEEEGVPTNVPKL